MLVYITFVITYNIRNDLDGYAQEMREREARNAALNYK